MAFGGNWAVLGVVCLLLVAGGADGEDLREECSDKFQKVMACLNYATGKEATPSKDCCISLGDIKDSDPKCLCFVLQQTHNGSAEIKSLGIQEARLFQLPSACQLKNASLSDCPKALGIPPNSPDAAIFTNPPTVTPPTPSGKAAPTTATTGDKSSATLHAHYFAAPLMIVAAAFAYFA